MLRVFSLTTAALPLALLITFVSGHYFAAPYLDQWTFVEPVARAVEGDFPWDWLYLQTTSHKILFPKLVILGLAAHTRWNHGVEVAFIIGLGIALFAVVAIQLHRSTREAEQPFPWLLLPVLSVLTFSLAQYQNWLWGLQIQVFLNLLASTGGLLLLAGRVTLSRLAAAVALGVVATHSFSTGLAFWPVGVVALALAPAPSGRARRSALAVWAAVALAAVASWAIGYRVETDGLPGFGAGVIGFGAYVLAYLGGPVAASRLEVAYLAGAIGVLALASVVAVLRRSDVSRSAWLPFVAIALYAVGAAGITALGRAQMGAVQAVQSRYASTANLLWVALVCIGGLLAARTRDRAVRVVAAVLAAILLTAAADASWRGRADAERRASSVARAVRMLRSNHPEVPFLAVRLLNGERPMYARERVPLLARFRLSLFASLPTEEAVLPRRRSTSGSGEARER